MKNQICGSNQQFDGVKCVCNTNYIMVNNICYLSCGRNAYIKDGQCSCIPGYSFSQTARVCTQIQDNGIICGSNFIVVNNVCVCR